MQKKVLSFLLAGLLVLSLCIVGIPHVSAAQNMQASDACVDLIKSFEGFEPYVFWDYSQYSIGYGSFCSYTQDETYWKYVETPISEEEATEKLIQQLQSYINQVRWFLNTYNLTVEQHQFDAPVR